MPITRIVSGGQTGADRGGLAAALHCRLPHGGWCPQGRRSEDGTIPSRYHLQEHAASNYVARTEANVVDSDATLIFSYGNLEGGSLKTAQFAQKHKKPWLHVDLEKLPRQQAVDRIVKWLNGSCPKECVLNVAGQRASKAPPIAGVVKAWMVDVISKANGTAFYPVAEDADEKDQEDQEDEETIEVLPSSQLNGLAKAMQTQFASMPLYHPKTLEEAIQIILKELSPERRAMIRVLPREEFLTAQHFGLATAVRNCMIHRNENLLDLMADFQRGCRENEWIGTAEPDGVSRAIVEQVWERLQGDKG